MVSQPQPVPFGPDSFCDDLPDLSLLSLEEVVSRFRDVERRRTVHTEPESEAETWWGVRSAPVELMSSLQVIAKRLGVSRNVLTKCMSRHLIDWYDNALGMGSLVTAYHDIYAKIKLRSYTTLRIQAEHPARFSLANQPEVVAVSVSTIRWVVARLDGTREVLGVGKVDLLLVGMAWSLTTLGNQDWDQENIKQYFQPEADNMRLLVADRREDVEALGRKYALREKNRFEANQQAGSTSQNGDL